MVNILLFAKPQEFCYYEFVDSCFWLDLIIDQSCALE